MVIKSVKLVRGFISNKLNLQIKTVFKENRKVMNKYFLTISLILMAFTAINGQNKINLTANGVTKTATLVKNEATDELISLLEKGPLTLSMTENGGFEKVGNLPQSLTTSDERLTAQSGDIMLYVGNVMCVFYGSNTWAYTKLGTLDDMTSSEIKEFLSGNPVEVVLWLGNEAGIKEIKASEMTDKKVFDLNGRIVSQRPLEKGLYVIDGRKTLIK